MSARAMARQTASLTSVLNFGSSLALAFLYRLLLTFPPQLRSAKRFLYETIAPTNFFPTCACPVALKTAAGLCVMGAQTTSRNRVIDWSVGAVALNRPESNSLERSGVLKN